MKDINATILVDLTPTEEEIFQNIHKDARWGIKKALKNGLKVKQTEDWETFYPIYQKTMATGGGFIHSLKTVKETSAILFLCYYKNKPIAGLSIGFRDDKYDKNLPSLSKLASLKEYQNLQPNNLLVWEAIKWSKKKGYKKFDMGGWQIKAQGHLVGINKFKERWGELTYYYKDYPIKIAIGRKLVRNFPLIKKIWDKIKKEVKKN